MYRILASKYGYTPQEIANMTPAQQFMMLSGESTMTFNTQKELQQFLTGRRS